MQPIRPSRAIPTAGWPIAVAMALAGCGQAPRDDRNGADPVEEMIVNLPDAVAPVTPMDRQTLLLAVAKAASARATGMNDEVEQRELEGQPFEFAIRFGCSGAVKDLRSTALGWSYQPDRETLRVRATPTITAADTLAAAISGEAVEKIEGFWVPLPWLLHPMCPANTAQPVTSRQPPAEQPSVADQKALPQSGWPKVGIAQFFTENDARTRRRDRRAYEAVTTVDQGPSVGSQGFNLVLSGRLRTVRGKRVIECVAEARDAPPDCIVSAHIDEVRVEVPADGAVLARWSS